MAFSPAPQASSRSSFNHRGVRASAWREWQIRPRDAPIWRRAGLYAV